MYQVFTVYHDNCYSRLQHIRHSSFGPRGKSRSLHKVFELRHRVVMMMQRPPLSPLEHWCFKSVWTFFRGLVLGLHIEVAHAKVGSMANPQSKVVGVEYRFRSADVEFRCVGFGACKSQVWPRDNLPLLFW